MSRAAGVLGSNSLQKRHLQWLSVRGQGEAEVKSQADGLHDPMLCIILYEG